MLQTFGVSCLLCLKKSSNKLIQFADLSYDMVIWRARPLVILTGIEFVNRNMRVGVRYPKFGNLNLGSNWETGMAYFLYA